jgi:hypothetical protein
VVGKHVTGADDHRRKARQRRWYQLQLSE